MRRKERKGIRGVGTSLRSVVGIADDPSVAALPHPPLRSGPLLHSLRSLAPPTLRVVGVPLEPSLTRVAPAPGDRCRGPRTEPPATSSQVSLETSGKAMQTPRGTLATGAVSECRSALVG